MPVSDSLKQRAFRIPLDFHQKPNFIEKWKCWLAWASLVVTVLWYSSGFLFSDRGKTRYSRGPVASVHAIWEENCTACHVPFTPISGNTWASSLFSDPHASNQKCQDCHARPAHHDNQTPELSCASCHRDHRGRDVSLVDLPNSDCTQCHAKLAEHRRDKVLDIDQNIHRFSKGGHPEFQAVKSDPGHLLFSHKRHMAAGLDMSMTWKQLEGLYPGSWKRYGKGKSADSLVKLACQACHRADDQDFRLPREQSPDLPAHLLRARTSGAYMAPITYDIQCKTCHPLTFDGKEAVRHRLEPKEIHAFLEGYYTARALQADPKLFERWVPPRPKPGKMLAQSEEKLRELIHQKVYSAERNLYLGKKNCMLCHVAQSPSGAKATITIDKKKIPSFTIKPTNVSEIWFKKAKFDHAKHRAIDCKTCHPRAYADSPNASTQSKDVLIPGISNCLECHAPRTLTDGVIRGGAKHNCTECHRYHHGAEPLHGIGSKKRGPRHGALDLDSFRGAVSP